MRGQQKQEDDYCRLIYMRNSEALWLWCRWKKVTQIASRHINTQHIVLYSHILSVCRVHRCCIAVAPEDNDWWQDVQRGIKLPQKQTPSNRRGEERALSYKLLQLVVLKWLQQSNNKEEKERLSCSSLISCQHLTNHTQTCWKYHWKQAKGK